MNYSDMEFKEIFDQAIESLKSQSYSTKLFDSHFDWYKNLSYMTMTDDDIFWVLVYVTFYSGMRAATVSQRLPALKKYFGNFKKVKDYSQEEINQIINDPTTIHHKQKIKACVDNAKLFYDLIARYKSFQNFLKQFEPLSNESNINKLKLDLQRRFRYLGSITIFHFLTDLGINVLKPDRVVCRIFERLGMIDDKNNIDQVIEVGKKFSTVTSLPIRCIDIIFAKFGQMGEDTFFGESSFGLKNGICFERNPHCYICKIKKYCRFNPK